MKTVIEVESGDIVKTYDHSEVEAVYFGKQERARFTGKVKGFYESPSLGPCVEVWSEPPAAPLTFWGTLRVLPESYIIKVETTKTAEVEELASNVARLATICEVCGSSFYPKRNTAKYCGETCRNKAKNDGRLSRTVA